jgi:hypothetical protein
MKHLRKFLVFSLFAAAALSASAQTVVKKPVDNTSKPGAVVEDKVIKAKDVKKPDTKASDSVDSSVKTAPKSAIATEHGEFFVQLVRNGVVIAEEIAPNFLADEGEADFLACFYQATSCPTSFTVGLLSTTSTPVESSSWASLSATELVTGTSPGYASWTAARTTAGWYGTTSGSAPTSVANGTGGCTETACAQVSTAQNTITASGNWTIGGRYIYIRAATTNRLIAVAQLSADRTLQSGDQLNVTYRQAMQ